MFLGNPFFNLLKLGKWQSMDASSSHILTLAQALDAVSEGVFVLSTADYEVLLANKKMHQLLDVPTDLKGQNLHEVMSSGPCRWLKKKIQCVVQTEEAETFDLPTSKELSSAQHWKITLQPLHEKGVVTSVLGTLSVQTEQVRERVKQRQQERYVTALEQAPYGVCFVDESGVPHMVNRTLCRWLDRSRESVSGIRISDFIHIDDRQVFAQALLKAATEGRAYENMEVRLQLPENLMWASVCLSRVVEGENAGYTIVQFVDITKRKANEDKLMRLATRDHLTGLSNRMVFDDALQLAVKKARRYGRPGAVVYIDMDDFKSINDNYGHKAGDAALQEMAHVLKHVFRETDVVCRIGGDEFAVIMSEVSEALAVAKIQQVEHEIRSLHVMAHGKNVAISASLGLQCFDGQDEITIDQIIESADRAMFDKKRASRSADWRPRAQ